MLPKTKLIPRHYLLVGIIIGGLIGYFELHGMFGIVLGIGIGIIMAWLTAWHYHNDK